MSDHEPRTPDRDDGLDRHIRELVGRAVADTPSTPRLDEGVLMQPTDQPTRNRWIVGGLAGLSVAAAIVAIFLFSRPDERADPLVPATQSTITVTAPSPAPTDAPTTAVATTNPPATTVASSAPATTSPATAPTTTPPTAPPTTAPPTTEPPPAAGTERAELVIAGPDGVRRDDRVVTEQPMARALPLADGRTLMQRIYNVSGSVDDSALLVVAPGSTEVVPLDVPVEFEGLVVRLHDAAVVDGEIIVIVETGPQQCANPTSCIGAIWAFGPDTGRLDQLQEKIVWEGGWSRLSIAVTGVIAGTETESVTSTLRSWIVPGSSGTPVDYAAEGLESSYGDCSDCPTGFAIDRSGAYLAWVATDLDTFQTTLVYADLRSDAQARLPLVDGGTVCCLDDDGPDLPFVPVVEINRTVDGDLETFEAVVNDEGVLNGGPPRPSLVVDVATGEVTAVEGFHVYG